MRTGKWVRPVAIALTVVLLAFVAYVLVWSISVELGNGWLGQDLTLYTDATKRWLDGGPFYPAYQVQGPYVIGPGAVLYPPSTIPLFAAFTVLPAVLFWVIPLTVIGAVVIHHRPKVWAWPLMAACLVPPTVVPMLIHGNPFMWVAAAVSLGTVYGWPAVFVLLKPSLFPFALIGVRQRTWWVALGLCALVALAFLPMWPDYIRVLTNARSERGILYSLIDVPLLLIPLISRAATPAGSGSAP